MCPQWLVLDGELKPVVEVSTSGVMCESYWVTLTQSLLQSLHQPVSLTLAAHASVHLFTVLVLD